jgi:hypothetical protein
MPVFQPIVSGGAHCVQSEALYTLNMAMINRQDIRNAVEPYLLQQTNCLTVTAHGLSAIIQDAFPYCTIYSQREPLQGRNLAKLNCRPPPGTCQVFPPVESPGPTIICLNAQWDFGSPGMKSNRPQTYTLDSEMQRSLWFRSALDHAANVIPANSSIAVPWKIGCGKAKGNWQSYLNMLLLWASRQNYTLVLYYKSM